MVGRRYHATGYVLRMYTAYKCVQDGKASGEEHEFCLAGFDESPGVMHGVCTTVGTAQAQWRNSSVSFADCTGVDFGTDSAWRFLFLLAGLVSLTVMGSRDGKG